MNVIVSGSLAYDRIMDFPGNFSDHILPDKIHVLNVSFTVNSMVEKFGGTAGNISYALRLLGEKPIILATIGRDHERYFDWLQSNQIAIDSIRIIEEEFTACAYITTDRADNQITGFNPGSMKYPSSFDFGGIDTRSCIAIVAPGNLEDMRVYSQTYQSRGIDFIFDPGQSLPMWDGGELAECISGSRILVSNDYELDLIINMTGLDRTELLKRTGVIITTLGEQGSRVYTADDEIVIPAVKPGTVVDPTGAGDAYRAGLIKGLVQRKKIAECAMMGSVCASYAVEHYGTQGYHFSLEEFQKRLDKCKGLY
ncbi:MAG: carbohydrate kinase family protein [Dehalococcoidia bacterium]|nr:MAG: carbohydrate kinase family protein [Dehalococcoidia bacterium]